LTFTHSLFDFAWWHEVWISADIWVFKQSNSAQTLFDQYWLGFHRLIPMQGVEARRSLTFFEVTNGIDSAKIGILRPKLSVVNQGL